jgi:hypothetical protein
MTNMSQKQEEREKRLAEALRANLRKRKARGDDAVKTAPDNPDQAGSL